MIALRRSRSVLWRATADDRGFTRGERLQPVRSRMCAPVAGWRYPPGSIRELRSQTSVMVPFEKEK